MLIFVIIWSVPETRSILSLGGIPAQKDEDAGAVTGADGGD